jgi:hypothetical protein
MKLLRSFIALGLSSSAALAQTTQNYPDTTGDLAPAVGTHPHIDITSVDVTVDATGTDISFKINLSGNPVTTTWGKYMIGIRSNPGGATTGNAWGRPIHMAGGMTHWIGAWADDGGPTGVGANLRSYGSGWTLLAAPSITRDSNSLTITTTTADLSLAPGETFSFDVYTSGGNNNDSAVDALSASGQSVGGWGGPYTTNAVGGTPNPARTFTMAGEASYATWIASFGLTGNDALGSTDYDQDGLTNQQEFDLDLGLDPASPDSDGDDLKDGEETLDGIYDGPKPPDYALPRATGTNPMIFDTDGDGVSDGEEAKPTEPGAYEQNPNRYNHAKMVVPGTFNTPATWNETGTSLPTNEMSRVGQSLTEQYQWALDYRFTVPKAQITYKFAAGTWSRNWGATGNAGVAAPNGGDINRVITASGIHRFTFDTVSLAHTFTRPTFADATAYLAAYGLAAGADQDGDGVNNEDEFTKNSDPFNANTDGDTLADEVDPDPLVPAPESRQVVFQVNMNVAASNGQFTLGTSTVRVIGQFDGWSTTGGVVLADADSDGIYTGTYQAVGFAGVNFGTYKFYIDGVPNGGYEQGADRNFVLGADGVQQVLPVVYFSNVAPAGFTEWIGGYPGLSDTSRGGDPDGDGVTNEHEFLFGTSPATGAEQAVAITRDGSNLTLTWLQRSAGATYVLQANAGLAGAWSAASVTPTAGNQTGVPTGYTRMQAVVPIGAGHDFFRVNGTEN